MRSGRGPATLRGGRAPGRGSTIADGCDHHEKVVGPVLMTSGGSGFASSAIFPDAIVKTLRGENWTRASMRRQTRFSRAPPSDALWWVLRDGVEQEEHCRDGKPAEVDRHSEDIDRGEEIPHCFAHRNIAGYAVLSGACLVATDHSDHSLFEVVGALGGRSACNPSVAPGCIGVISVCRGLCDFQFQAEAA